MTPFELTKEYLERLQQALESGDDSFIISSLDGVMTADISALLEEFTTEESKYVVELLDKSIGAEIISDLDEDIRDDFLKVFTSQEVASFIEYLESDDAVDILNQLPVQQREEVISHLENREKEAHILDLLRYEEDVAGGLMAKELIKVNLNWTIRECINEIRRQAENVEKIYSMYVVDSQDKLLGRVSLKRVIITDDDTKIADIYETDLISVETYMEQEEVALLMQKYDLDAVPVVNVKGKLVGRITLDDIVDVITETAEEERQLMSGISEDVEEDDSVWMLTRARLPWLIIGVVGGLVSSLLMDSFEADLTKSLAIAFFVPLIMATGGNVGIQSSSIVVQSLANPSAFDDSMLKRLIKVLLVALLNGLVLGLLVMTAMILTMDNAPLALVVACALFCVVLVSSFMGTITPLLLDRLGVNPALASGPFITTTNDILGLAIYFLIIHFWI